MSKKCIGRPSLLYHECCERIAELEAEVERLGKDRERLKENLRVVNEDFSPEVWEQVLQEKEMAQAQLRDAQGQVAALASYVKARLPVRCEICRDDSHPAYGRYQNILFRDEHGYFKHGVKGHFIECMAQEERQLLAGLPAASKAILAAAEERAQLLSDLQTLRVSSDNPLTPSELKLLRGAEVAAEREKGLREALWEQGQQAGGDTEWHSYACLNRNRSGCLESCETARAALTQEGE